MLTINSMDNTKSIRIIDIQSREIDPYTISEQYRGDPSYLVQLFGLDEQRNTYSVFVEGFAPYFYVKIDAGNKKSNFTEEGFEQWLSEKLADKYIKGIEEITLENHKKLYGFDAGTKHNFVKISFPKLFSLI